MSPISFQTQSRSEALREHLRDIARRLGPGTKLPKVTDLCGDLKVSPNTLNAALKDLEYEGLVTRRHAVGIFVSENMAKRAQHWALICRPDFFRTAGHSPFWDLLVEGIRERAARSSATIDPYFCRADNPEFPLPDALAQAIENGNIGGVLGVGLLSETAAWIMARGVPVVNLFGKGHAVFVTDGPGQIELCVGALAVRDCQKIGLWQPVVPLKDDPSQFDLQKLLRDAFEAALEAQTLVFDPARIENHLHWLESGKQVPSRAEQGYETAWQLFQKPRETWPDGLVVTDDTMTHGALVALRRLGLEAGRDVHIATFANTHSPVLSGESGLILAEIDPQLMVETMFERLESLSQESQLPANEELIIIPPSLREIAPGRPVFSGEFS